MTVALLYVLVGVGSLAALRAVADAFEEKD